MVPRAQIQRTRADSLGLRRPALLACYRKTAFRVDGRDLRATSSLARQPAAHKWRQKPYRIHVGQEPEATNQPEPSETAPVPRRISESTESQTINVKTAKLTKISRLKFFLIVKG